jgi:hypothetical protein
MVLNLFAQGSDGLHWWIFDSGHAFARPLVQTVSTLPGIASHDN